MHDISDRCASMEQEKFENIYLENFEFDKSAWIESKTVKELYDRLVTNQRGEMGFKSFVKFLESRGNRKIRPSKDGERVRGFRYLKAKGTSGLKLSDYELRKNHVGIDGKEEE